MSSEQPAARGLFPRLLEDLRDCPGTGALAASWIVVFALMVLAQRGETIPAAANAGGPFPVMTTTSHRFGDLSWNDLGRGEVWRAWTATFVHYSLIHLVMNLAGLVTLGRLVEPWYGSGPFVGLCLTIGGLGNLLGWAMRRGMAWAQAAVEASGWLKGWPGVLGKVAPGALEGASEAVDHHTGGGSTILLGLIGLAAVVGWRSRTRIGSFLGRQMVILLVATAVLGLVIHLKVKGFGVDNYGHAGGAIVGALLAFGHRRLVKLGDLSGFRRLGWAFAAILAGACLAFALVDARVEGNALRRREADLLALRDLDRLSTLYGRILARAPLYRELFRELDAIALGLASTEPLGLFPITPAPGLNPNEPEAEAKQAARERSEMLGVLERLDRLTDGPWSASASDDLAELRILGRDALGEVPSFERAYRFRVDLDLVRKAIVEDLGPEGSPPGRPRRPGPGDEPRAAPGPSAGRTQPLIGVATKPWATLLASV